MFVFVSAWDKLRDGPFDICIGGGGGLNPSKNIEQALEFEKNMCKVREWQKNIEQILKNIEQHWRKEKIEYSEISMFPCLCLWDSLITQDVFSSNLKLNHPSL